MVTIKTVGLAQVQPLSATPAYHMADGSNPCIHMEKLEKDPGSWLQSAQPQFIPAIWGVNQQTENTLMDMIWNLCLEVNIYILL